MTASAEPFDRQQLVAKAKALSTQDFVPPKRTLPKAFAEIDYDEYRTLRLRDNARLLKDDGSRFSIDPMAPGFLYQTPVEIYLVQAGDAELLAFDPARFELGDLEEAARNSSGMFYSGFRIRFPINRPDVQDEVAVFQGATYFRAVGRSNLYGLSARGLAIKTADPAGEEFPYFSKFWIEKPEKFASTITVHALLDSPSMTGAYTFDVTPGQATIVEVEATLFPRSDQSKVGIAPLTSMFLFDASNRARFDDYRNAVHDSNGLQMLTGTGDRLWRALANPRDVRMSAFSDHTPGGFGLVERSRRFIDFEDAEAKYHKRPSAWVEPTNDWGRGSVVLVEIPTNTEYNDNIVSFWQPADTMQAGKQYDYRYRVHWSDLPGDQAPLARVVATRSGATDKKGMRHFVIDFDAVGMERDPLPDVSNSSGRISNVTLSRVANGERLRVAFDLAPGDSPLVELSVSLKDEGRSVSEQWLYQWTPNS